MDPTIPRPRPCALAQARRDERAAWAALALIVAGCAALLAAAIAATPAAAHTAPAGWRYDGACCNAVQQHADGRVTGDCAPIPARAVAPIPGGYRVTLAPGDHPRIPEGGVFDFDARAKIGDAHRVRPSPDGDFHACLVPGRARCLYLPGSV